MRRQRTLKTKIFLRADEATPEKRSPVAVDGDSCSQRVVRRDQPIRQGQPIGGRVRRQRRQGRKATSRDKLFRLEVLATMMSMGRARVVRGSLLQDQRGRQRDPLSTQRFDLLPRTGEFRCGRAELLHD